MSDWRDMHMFDISDVALRLGAATLFGALLGLNRDLHGKPTGVRTLGLVALGAAAVTFVAVDSAAEGSADANALSRVMQGVLTGIGFLGAGVILHQDDTHRVSGLTTSACVWLTACVGMVCGTANWKLFFVMLPLVAVLLFIGGPLEKMLHHRWPHKEKEPPEPPHSTS